MTGLGIATMCADGCSGCSAQCAACASARLQAAASGARASLGDMRFNPNQPRDAEGQWTEGGAAGWGKPTGAIPGTLDGKDAFRAAPDKDAAAGRISDKAVAESLPAAVDHYAGNGYVHMNSSLRRGQGLYEGEKKFVRALDAGIEASPLPEDATLWRGITNGGQMFGGEWFGRSLVGAEWSEPSFVSTTANMDRADHFAKESGDPVTMRMRAPAGIGGLQVGKWGSGGTGKESEVLLGRGNRFRVVADHGVVKGSRRIDVEIIPGTPGPPEG